MVWKGVIIGESLDDKSVLNMVKIAKTRKTTLENESNRGTLNFYYFELDDEDKNAFIKKVSSLIKNRFYVHICQGNDMVVIYKDKFFEFSSEKIDKLEEARKYGLSIGILIKQMPFEKLIKYPFA